MSKYTTELRFYLETLAGLEESTDDIAKVLSESWAKVFDFDFPIYNESHREELCKKILMHYYFREIGMETIGAWKIKLQSNMLEIMPYYNKLYGALDEEFSLNKTRETYIEREYQGSYNFTGNTQSENSNTINLTDERNDTSKFLDTPQGGLEGILDTDYLTTATINSGENTQTTKNNGNTETNTKNANNDEHSELEHNYGNSNILDNVEKYNAEIFNIDLRIIKDLNILFMKLW